jgi:outer membrane protein assembly factor BamB
MRHLVLRSALLVTLAAGLSAHTPPADPTWPGWRGHDGNGRSEDVALPDRWTPDTNIAWKTPIPGRAHSSPIVWGNQIFLTTAIEGAEIPGHTPLKHTIEGSEWRSPDAVGGNRRHTLQVMSVDTSTGKVQWVKTAYEGPMYDDRHSRGSYAAPTPVTDGERLYAYFGTEGVYAYSMEGELVWSRQLGKVAGLSVGVSTSPVMYRGLVIVQADEDNGETSFITALDGKTGKDVWRVARKAMPISWATPLLTSAGGRPELITTTDTRIIAYDPATGRELWSEPGLESYAVPSPVVSGRHVIISTGNPKKITIALKLGSLPEGEKRQSWDYRKGSAYVVSPTAHDGLVYIMSDGGILTCLKAETGAVVYEGGRPPVPSSFFSSPVVFGGHLYMTSEEGDTFVVKAGATHEIVRTNSVGEPVYASPALANGTIYMRGLHHLFAIRQPR